MAENLNLYYDYDHLHLYFHHIYNGYVHYLYLVQMFHRLQPTRLQASYSDIPL